MKLTRFFKTLLITMALSVPAFASLADPLPALKADPAKISVSGLSSGAFMAVQYDVAFSASTIGAGIVAGGPYNCAYANPFGVPSTIATCMQGIPDSLASYVSAQAFADLNKIDPVQNIAKQKIYLFSGTQDIVVKQSVMDSLRDFFSAANVPDANLVYINTFPAGHAFISPDFGNLCDVNANPYINECSVNSGHYDQPAAIFNQIYGPLKPKAQTLSAQPIAFDQTEFAGSLTGMADKGFVYIPASCQQTKGQGCALHVVFHGCGQSVDSGAGDDVYSKVGYNQWADSNNIIVLYPQVNKSEVPLNPQGCWDWWGYTGLDFQVQSGKQLSAIHAMVVRLTGQ